MKHEHYHYHIKVDSNGEEESRYKPIQMRVPPSQSQLSHAQGLGDQLVRPGDQAISFQVRGDSVSFGQDHFTSPTKVKKRKGPGDVGEEAKQQIMINNFHLPPSKQGSPHTATTSTTTTTTTPEPYKFVVVQRPNSDLQQFQPSPMSLRYSVDS